ncbi:MAG: type II secretion system F family protein [Porticoccaceae bacterium]|nr:type II secretion system F family protein [Porticoccaceae bacterium]
MPTYQYLAYDKAGKEVRSSSAADSPRQLRRELGEKGLYVSDVKELRAKEGKLNWFKPRIAYADLSLIMRQLAILVNSGMPLEEALRLTAEQSDSHTQKSLLESWREGLASGHSFAASVRKSPYVIAEKIIAAISVAEETGHLHKVLLRVADELEVGNQNRQTLMKGMIYPAVMIVVALVVISVLVGYVVPQVAKVFVNSRQELPLLTRATMVTSDFLRAWGIYLLIAQAGCWLSFLLLLRNPGRRKRWHRLLLGMPLFGNWVLLANLADWCRSLGTLLQSGVPVLSALSISSAGVGNLYLKEKLEAVNERVRQGNSLFQSLKSEGVAPGFLLHMVSSGEASSELDQMLLRVSEYYSTRLRNAVDTMLKLMEPALIVFMGMVVMLIVGAVLVPIVKMNQLI